MKELRRLAWIIYAQDLKVKELESIFKKEKRVKKRKHIKKHSARVSPDFVDKLETHLNMC